MIKLIKCWWNMTIAPLYFGGGGSSSAATTTTNNLDKRLVVSSGTGVSADNSNVTINNTDGGAVTAAMTFANNLGGKAFGFADSFGRTALGVANNANVGANSLSGQALGVASGTSKAALDFASGANAANSANYDKLLAGTGQALDGIFKFADKTLANGYGSLATSQTNAAAFVDTVQSKGAMDNRTMTILGVSAAAALAAFALRK